MGSFLKLEDFLIPPPFPAILAVLMVFGLVSWGNLLVRWLHRETPQPTEAAAAFVLVTSIVAAGVHLLAWPGLAYIWLFRIFAWSLALLGLWEIVQAGRRRLSGDIGHLKVVFQEQSWGGKTALVLLGITAAALFLTALGPPTDADSLDYHLGVPLDILRHHGVYPRMDWFFARMAGLGEYLNLLGVAGGTDILGAVLQFAGLVAVLIGVTSLATHTRDKILLSMAVLGCPIIAFLVPNQKPQMLPTAATTIALILLARRSRNLDPLTLLLSFGCAGFAMSCKYSFLVSGALVMGVGIILAYRAGLGGLAMLIAGAVYLVLVLPLQLQNYFFYGDPLSPLLERFRPHGNPELIRFASYDRVNMGLDLSVSHLFTLIVPDSPGNLTTVLGVGVLLVVVALSALRKPGPSRLLLVSALILAPFSLALSLIQTRYLLEPYFWIVAAAAGAAGSFGKKWIFPLLTCQMVVMALVVGFGAVTLFPGALTSSWRNTIMTRAAYQYAATRWLNQVLSPDAIVLTEMRSVALLPRPFLSKDFLEFADLGAPTQREKVISLMQAHRVNTLVLSWPVNDAMIKNLGLPLEGPIAGPQAFPGAARNPWNRGPVTNWAVYWVNSSCPESESAGQ